MPIVVQLDIMLARRKVKSKDLAEHVGITEANMSLLKQGRVKGVRFDTLEKICDYLQCQPGDLLVHEPNQPYQADKPGEQPQPIEHAMSNAHFYPIGIAGQPWGPIELELWRTRQRRQRSYADDVLSRIERLRERFDIATYGEVVYAGEHFPLMAIRSRHWQNGLPTALVTGGVHGYETSGVHGALHFLEQHAQRFAGQVNLLVAPCVSPWAYERIQRWNFDAIDPNRSFREASPAQESAALMRLVAPLRGQLVAHIDLHETTDTDETEYRPAVAARDGKAFEPCTIPDGFYLVDDAANPQPAFQQALIHAVQQVTHIAPADAHGGIIGSALVAPGVIHYAMQALGLCAGITGARYTSTTEVYPDSPRTTPGQCVDAQVAVVCAALAFIC